MKYTSRCYQSKNDLYGLGKLIRGAYGRSKFINAWSFCRFDIWSQRRIADAESFHDPIWQKNFQFWLDENNGIVGAAFAFDNHHFHKNPDPHGIILHPDHLQLAETMLDWMEEHAAPDIEVVEENAYLRDMVAARGYARSDDFMFIRERPLTGTAIEEVKLADDYKIKILKQDDWHPYFNTVNTVFNMMDTVEAFASIQQAPSNIPELHLNVLNKQNEIAAFCSVWKDEGNNLAEFEPVGTLPQFQKQGLASALMNHAMNHLRKMGCSMVKVESWSESEGANKLYSSLGMQEVGRIYSWKK